MHKTSIKIYDIHLQANVGQCNWDIKSLQNEIKKQTQIAHKCTLSVTLL